MGFGLLLIGYFLSFATSLATVYFFADIFGGALMVYALYKLSAYSEKFKNTIPSAMLFTCISTLAAILSLFKATSVLTIVTYGRAASVILLHVYMFTSLADMAEGADDGRLAARARRDLSLTTVYYVMYLVLSAFGDFMDLQLKSYLSVLLYFYAIIITVLNLLLIHSAYCRLYIEGSAERYSSLPQYKESKIPFITGIRKRYYESRKRAMEDDRRMMEEYRDYVSANKHKIPPKKKKKNR